MTNKNIREFIDIIEKKQFIKEDTTVSTVDEWKKYMSFILQSTGADAKFVQNVAAYLQQEKIKVEFDGYVSPEAKHWNGMIRIIFNAPPSANTVVNGILQWAKVSDCGMEDDVTLFLFWN